MRAAAGAYPVRNATRGTVVTTAARDADTFLARFLGLMGRAGLPEGAALVIAPCNSIHMFFMRFPLDVIFTDDAGTVVALYPDIRPWRISKIHKGATRAVELNVGAIAASRTEIGDRLSFERG